MAKEKKKNISGRLYKLISLGLLLLPLVIFSCHQYYEMSVNKALVDQFCISSKLIFAQKLDSDSNLEKTSYDHLLLTLSSFSNDLPLLAQGYAQNNYKYLFIENHAISKKHEIVNNRVKNIYFDGVNLAAYKYNDHGQYISKLVSLNEQIITFSSFVTPESEKELLYNKVEEATAAKGSSLSPLEVFELCLGNGNSGQFPTIENAWNNVYKLAQERAVLEADIEADTGRWYFMLLDELLINDKLFLKNWNLFQSDQAAAILEMEPDITHYANLKTALKQYLEYNKTKYDDYDFKAKTNTKIKAGSKGATETLIVRVKKRLALEGYWKGEMTPVWDETLTQALTHFQENNQIVPDGVYGHGTAKSFNLSIADRITRIRIAMKRIRHSAGRWDKYYLRINIPQFLLEVREDNKILRTHKIIVGNKNPKNHTPTFSDEVELVNFNPSWFVPQRIIKEEMQPAFEKNEEYFNGKGYRAIINDEGKVLSVTQPPGRGNALGNVKILFPNPHDVYLHDTPSKYLFKRTIRPFSHGCMRCQNASDLAAFLLEKDGNPELANVPTILEKRIPKEIYLKSKVPVHVEYVIASSNEKGEVIFFGDVYNNEKEVFLVMSNDGYLQPSQPESTASAQLED